LVAEPTDTTVPEAVVFDKADEAESLEKLRATLLEVAAQIGELKAERKKAEDGDLRQELERRIDWLGRRQSALEKHIAAREEEGDASS
jgi:hypothetical protein